MFLSRIIYILLEFELYLLKIFDKILSLKLIFISTYLSRKESKVRLHPTSALIDLGGRNNDKLGPAYKNLISSLGSDWLVYDEMVRIGLVTHVRNITVVSPLTVLLLAGPMRIPLDALSEPSHSKCYYIIFLHILYICGMKRRNIVNA